jgi:hypothetical protein
MSWNEEIESIKLGTLFIFFGKTLLAGILWYIILTLIIVLPILAVMAAFGFSSL